MRRHLEAWSIIAVLFTALFLAGDELTPEAFANIACDHWIECPHR